MHIIKNGLLVLEDEILENHALVVEEDRIKAVIPESDISHYEEVETEIIDAQGHYVSPGFIDIHSDYIENIICPRPTVMMDFKFGIKEAERLLVTSGITTMFHSLSMYANEVFGKNKLRRADNAFALIEELCQAQKSERLIHNRVHARIEIDNLDITEKVEKFIRQGKIDLISIMDHTPGQGQYSDFEVYRKTLAGFYGDQDDKFLEAKINERLNASAMAVEDIETITTAAREEGLAVASHDDDSVEKLDLVTDFNASISEFPITLEVAHEAKERGMHTVAGAPNILLGGSHAGNLSAAEGILEGAIDILCSDYYPSALAYSIFKMHRDHGVPLTEMFKKLTINPARAARIDDYTGSIEEGKQADLIIIDAEGETADIVMSMVSGQVVYEVGYRE